jgi:predicted membrane channel-forming protein YqfA (hemolysin III family)
VRVNATAVVGAGLGVVLAAVAHARHPAQVVVALAAGLAFLAILTRGRDGAASDWFTVRLLLAGNLVVFAIGNAHSLGSAAVVLLVVSGALLAVGATCAYLRGRGKRKIDR